jgi:hypothetical protein
VDRHFPFPGIVVVGLPRPHPGQPIPLRLEEAGQMGQREVLREQLLQRPVSPSTIGCSCAR